jgi:hypothetical protein
VSRAFRVTCIYFFLCRYIFLVGLPECGQLYIKLFNLTSYLVLIDHKKPVRGMATQIKIKIKKQLKEHIRGDLTICSLSLSPARHSYLRFWPLTFFSNFMFGQKVPEKGNSHGLNLLGLGLPLVFLTSNWFSTTYIRYLLMYFALKKLI